MSAAAVVSSLRVVRYVQHSKQTTILKQVRISDTAVSRWSVVRAELLMPPLSKSVDRTSLWLPRFGDMDGISVERRLGH